MGTVKAHTGLKLLSEKGAKLLILVPGAGLEPARTLPGPRDFKSHPALMQQRQTKSKSRFLTGLAVGVCSCLSAPFDGLGAAPGTVRAQRFAIGATKADVVINLILVQFDGVDGFFISLTMNNPR